MDCYDWKGCPGDCDICDLWIERQPVEVRTWLRFRRWFLDRVVEPIDRRYWCLRVRWRKARDTGAGKGGGR